MLSLDIGRVVRDGLRNTKVDELEGTFDQDKVGRLEVGMNDFLVVDGLDGFEHLVMRVQAVRNKRKSKEKNVPVANISQSSEAAITDPASPATTSPSQSLLAP